MTIAEHEHVLERTPSLGEDIARCVHCGFCLQACPTYLQLGTETDSPRGRIALIDALASGRAQPTGALVEHLDLCLQCRACETACPSGVAFGRIMETGRATVMEGSRRPAMWRLRALLLRETLPHQGRLRALFGGARLYARSPLQPMVRRSKLLRRFAPALVNAEASLPELPGMPFSPPDQPEGLTRSVALLTGCVMPHLYPRTHAATLRVLNRLGYRAVFPEQQTCCGALSLHAGDRVFARELARRNIDAFLAADVEAVVVNSAGCGSTMKEYGELLTGDAVYAERAQRLAAMTRDALEFVAEQDLGTLRELPVVVTYQDSCHLVHAQKVTTAPRAILRAIPGLELRELSWPDRCCGSAGIYTFVQGAMSRRLLAEKMDDVQTTGASIIATANPGCMTQIEAGLRQCGMGGRVVHVIELLDAAMRG
ncbi:MAG: heterodisulfide reductase-related iron-sulfur binding cluster [Chloroflexota bacterium]|nr:heterodisulfide reductase-related iron-sulfur binding cluster [Chloroflexota bacterium]